MAESLNIRKVLEELMSGRMRVPNFQRGFVWNPERVAYLMDSIYKGYPFGSILLWQTRQALTFERKLGPFELPANNPVYPTDYILDGQQRITSIFGVFQTDITLSDAPLWTKIYYDHSAAENAQESSFLALEDREVDSDRHFPISSLFDPVAYRRKTAAIKDEKLIEKLDNLQARFKEAIVPVQTISTEDKTAVAIVFERVNQRGVELDTIQLLSAWTWSGDFDLNKKFEELAEELGPFGFKGVGSDKDLLLRCCSAVLVSDPSAEALVTLNGSVVRSRFDEVVTGIKGAIDFLRKELLVQKLSNLPYDNILVPLSVYFSTTPSRQVRLEDRDRRRILKWFWSTCFARRYNSQPVKNLLDDVKEARKLKDAEDSRLDQMPWVISPIMFSGNNFRVNSVLSKSYVLALAQRQPRSFVSGSRIDLGAVLKEYNRNEFHHIFPRAAIKKLQETRFEDGCIANIAIISRSDNNLIGGSPPSEYRAKMPENVAEVLSSNLLPASLFSDDYNTFVEDIAEFVATLVTGEETPQRLKFAGREGSRPQYAFLSRENFTSNQEQTLVDEAPE